MRVFRRFLRDVVFVNLNVVAHLSGGHPPGALARSLRLPVLMVYRKESVWPVATASGTDGVCTVKVTI
jgi:hypothetical protein